MLEEGRKVKSLLPAFHPTNYVERTEQKWDETLASRKGSHLVCKRSQLMLISNLANKPNHLYLTHIQILSDGASEPALQIFISVSPELAAPMLMVSPETLFLYSPATLLS